MMRMKAFLFWACVVSVVASAAAPGVTTTAETKGGRAAQIERGRAVYGANCGRCHGADGKGHTRMGEMVEPPDLSDAAWQRKVSTSRMINSVTKGHGQMPAFARKLSKQDIAASVAYVRTLSR